MCGKGKISERSAGIKIHWMRRYEIAVVLLAEISDLKQVKTEDDKESEWETVLFMPIPKKSTAEAVRI